MGEEKVIGLVGLGFVHAGAVLGLLGGRLDAAAADGADIGAGAMMLIGVAVVLLGVALEVAALAIRRTGRRAARRDVT